MSEINNKIKYCIYCNKRYYVNKDVELIQKYYEGCPNCLCDNIPNYIIHHFNKKVQYYIRKKIAINNNQTVNKFRCYYCNKILCENDLEVEHKIPKCRGGTNNINNLALSCKKCNSKKRKKTEDEFI